jgi:hypothetical protein
MPRDGTASASSKESLYEPGVVSRAHFKTIPLRRDRRAEILTEQGHHRPQYRVTRSTDTSSNQSPTSNEQS